MGQKLQKADSSTKWVITLNAIKSNLGATLKIHDILHTLFGPSHLRDAGQSISISIPWVCDSLYSEVAFSSLDYKPHFSKHGVNRIPWRVWRAGQESTALHKNWSQSREKYWQATVATGLGQTHRPDCSCSMELGALG